MSSVVYLSFRSPHVEEGERAFMSCTNCQNKTFLMVMDKMDNFPLMQCAACSSYIGRMGWAHDDDPELQDT